MLASRGHGAPLAVSALVFTVLAAVCPLTPEGETVDLNLALLKAQRTLFRREAPPPVSCLLVARRNQSVFAHLPAAAADEAIARFPPSTWQRFLQRRGVFLAAGDHLSGIPGRSAPCVQSGSFHSQKRCITTCQAGTGARAAQQSTHSPQSFVCAQQPVSRALTVASPMSRHQLGTSRVISANAPVLGRARLQEVCQRKVFHFQTNSKCFVVCVFNALLFTSR